MITRFGWDENHKQENFIAFYMIQAKNDSVLNFNLLSFIRNKYFQS